MESFPTLSRKVSVEQLIDEPSFDPTMSSPYDSGHKQTRSRSTIIPKTFRRLYKALTYADKVLLEDFQNLIKVGSDAFTWHDLVSVADYTVRLLEKMSFEMITSENWRAVAIFEEAIPQEIADEAEVNQMFTELIAVEDLAAGADISQRPIFASKYDCSFTGIGILTKGAPAGVDNSNTVVITIKNSAGETLVSKTYNTANQPPTNAYASLGTLTNQDLDGEDELKIDVTQGATANMPAFDIVLDGYYRT